MAHFLHVDNVMNFSFCEAPTCGGVAPIFTLTFAPDDPERCTLRTLRNALRTLRNALRTLYVAKEIAGSISYIFFFGNCL